MLKNTKKIVIAVGGTGGHVFPAQAFAEELLLINPEVSLSFAGAELSTNTYFNKQLYPYQDIVSSTPFGKKPFQALFRISKGVLEAISYLRKESASLVVGFGSYHSFPILLAAKILRIPYVLFEANAIPGKVIKLLSKKALFTAIQLPQAKKYLKGTLKEVNLPLWLASQKKPCSSQEAKESYDLNPNILTILVFGGSQGATTINRAFKEACGLLKDQLEFQVIHILGRKDYNESLATYYQSLGIRACVKPFEENMAKAWLAADIAICRSGASTVAEMLHFNVPAILVPFPSATDNHQLINANSFMDKQAAVVIEEKGLKAGFLKEEIQKILKDSRIALAKNLQSLKESRPKTLASCVQEYLQTIKES